MLTDAAITSMRATLNGSLPDSCAIQRKAVTPDGQGGQTEAWATTVTVACRLSPLTDRGELETLAAGGMTAERPRVVTVPAGTDVTAADRLVIGGVTLEVEHVDSPRSYEISRRITAVEVQ